MFDTRPLERINSIVIGVVYVSMPLIVGVPLALLALLAREPRYGISAGALCCTAAAIPLFSLPLIGLMKWSRTGRAQSFLDEVAATTGGTVSCATWLWSLLSPRLSGTLDGRPFRLTLRRRAGILSPSRVGRRFAIFGWTYDLRVEAPIGAKIGFAKGGVRPVGVGLLGLSGHVELPELHAWTGTTEHGKELVERPDVQRAAADIVPFGPAGSLVRAGPDAVVLVGSLPTDVTPTDVAGLLIACKRLAQAASRQPD